jgi:hypothetical protein
MFLNPALMPGPQFRFDFAPRPTLRLSEIQEIMKAYRITGSAPSRDTLITLCEDGTFEAMKSRFGWLVFEDSFETWVRSLQHRAAA